VRGTALHLLNRRFARRVKRADRRVPCVLTHRVCRSVLDYICLRRLNGRLTHIVAHLLITSEADRSTFARSHSSRPTASASPSQLIISTCNDANRLRIAVGAGPGRVQQAPRAAVMPAGAHLEQRAPQQRHELVVDQRCRPLELRITENCVTNNTDSGHIRRYGTYVPGE